MNLRSQNILFFTRTMGIGGTENVVLQVCEIFNSLVNKIIVCSCGGVNVEKLEQMGIKHYIIPDIEKKGFSEIISIASSLRRIVRDENITVIHTHHRMAAFYVSILGLYKKCTFINTSHNTFTNKKFFTRFAYKHANLISCGEMVKKNLVDFYQLPHKQVSVVHNAVKLFEESIVEDKLLTQLHESGYFLVGNVGRLSEQKGMEYFINAIPEVIKHNDKVRFFIIGSGEDEAKLKELSNNLRVNDYVWFMGYRSDVRNIMSQLDLIVLSSLWEGLPLTPIEAFSVRKTVVATAVDGTVEVINDGKNGLLIESKNITQIADAVSWMMDNKDAKSAMEQQAYIDYLNEFSFEIFSKRYIDCYQKY